MSQLTAHRWQPINDHLGEKDTNSGRQIDAIAFNNLLRLLLECQRHADVECGGGGGHGNRWKG